MALPGEWSSPFRKWRMTLDYSVQDGFDRSQVGEAAGLFWTAFSQKLGSVLGPDDKALALLKHVIDPNFAISAIGPDGQLLGIAGFKTDQGAFVGGDFSDISDIYGRIGALWRTPLLLVLERGTGSNLLLMDGIFVSEQARGRGIGTVLLDAICSKARGAGLKGVRLDVIDTNQRARSLYERNGFVAQGTTSLGPLRWIFGFRSATTMIRPVSGQI